MPATPTSLSVRSARFCPSACLPDGLFYSHPTRRVMRDASSFLPPQAVWAPPASRRGHLSPTTKNKVTRALPYLRPFHV